MSGDRNGRKGDDAMITSHIKKEQEIVSLCVSSFFESTLTKDKLKYAERNKNHHHDLKRRSKRDG
jgi:hypothetical protein